MGSWKYCSCIIWNCYNTFLIEQFFRQHTTKMICSKAKYFSKNFDVYNYEKVYTKIKCIMILKKNNKNTKN